MDGKEILRGIDLVVGEGEIHALMGPNGAGKLTLASLVMGSPEHQLTGGRILLRGVDVAQLAPEERARMGVFLAFQYPEAIPVSRSCSSSVRRWRHGPAWTTSRCSRSGCRSTSGSRGSAWTEPSPSAT